MARSRFKYRVMLHRKIASVSSDSPRAYYDVTQQMGFDEFSLVIVAAKATEARTWPDVQKVVVERAPLDAWETVPDEDLPQIIME